VKELKRTLTNQLGSAKKQVGRGEKYSKRERKKEKGEGVGRHLTGERPEWTPRCLDESGWEPH